MAKIQPKNNKNIVTVGRLKQVVAGLKSDNDTMQRMMDNMGETEPEFLKKMSVKQSMINKYEKMIANPSKYKPKVK